jgi:hypothetical protein
MMVVISVKGEDISKLLERKSVDLSPKNKMHELKMQLRNISASMHMETSSLVLRSYYLEEIESSRKKNMYHVFLKHKLGSICMDLYTEDLIESC